MFRQIGAGEIILIVAVLLLFFGARKLPDLARSIGRSARELRKGLSGEDEEKDDELAVDPVPTDADGDEPASDAEGS